MKRKWIALLLAPVLAFSVLSACGADANKPDPSHETAEETRDANALSVAAISPKGEIDAVDPAIRAFLNEAEKRYNMGDTLYRFTAKKDSEDTLGSLPATVKFEWAIQNGDEVKSTAVQYGEDPGFTDYREVSPKRPGSSFVNVANLKTGASYYWRLAMTLTNGETVYSETFRFETKTGPRVLSIGGVKNARDMGGWLTADGAVVPEGRVFRSATLDHPNASGKAYLLEELGIRTELDLRNDEKDSRKPVLTSDLSYVNVPDAPGYSNFFERDEANAEILRVFTIPENYPIIFHCAEGADRTGLEGFLLNALCGVGEAELVCDYELTAGRFRDGSHDPAHTFDFPGFIQSFLRLNGDTTQEKARSYYINECGISEMELANYYALRMNDHGVYADPPKEAIASLDGTIVAGIVLRGSKSVTSVTDENGAALPFTFEGGQLTVTVSGAGRGTITFDDGGTLPILWV